MIPSLNITPNTTQRDSSAVILDQSGRVLLMLRDDMPMWVNIGGECNGDEDFITCLHREVMEEIQSQIIIKRHVVDSYASQPNNQGVRHEKVYLAHIAPHAPAPTLGNEGTRLEWFFPDHMPQNMGPIDGY